jgi:hypothetical protein
MVEHWHWVKLEISVGEVLIAISAFASAWWVSSVIQKKQASGQAIKDLVGTLCGEALASLSTVSDIIDGESARAGSGIDAVGRNKITRGLQRLSNSIHTVESATQQGKLLGLEHPITAAKDAAEILRGHVLDPLVVGAAVDLRQVEGAVRVLREAVVRLQLEVLAK